jgi:hypothetical protein
MSEGDNKPPRVTLLDLIAESRGQELPTGECVSCRRTSKLGASGLCATCFGRKAEATPGEELPCGCPPGSHPNRKYGDFGALFGPLIAAFFKKPKAACKLGWELLPGEWEK